MTELKQITIPIPEELLFGETDSLQNCILDISKIDFFDEELNKDLISNSLRYIRNMNLDVKYDFSSLSYEDKERWILEYINANLFDLNIKELNETVINLLSSELISDITSILSQEEIDKFKIDHKDLLDSIIQFLVSLDVILEYAIENAGNEQITEIEPESIKKLKEVEEKPSFFETIHQLIRNYPVVMDAIHLCNHDKFEIMKYTYVLHNIEKSSLFYIDLLNFPSFKFIGLMLDYNKDDSNKQE